MATDMWQKLKSKLLSSIIEDEEPSHSHSKDRNCSGKLKRITSVEQNVDWTEFEKYFAKGESVL